MADKKTIKRQQSGEQALPTYQQMSEGVYDRGTQDLFKTDEQKRNWSEKIANQDEIRTRKQQIQKLLSDYESKVRGQKMGKVFTGIQARTAAIHNPALAKSILETQSPLDTQQSDLIKQKMNLQGQKLKNIGSMQSVQQTDDDNNPSSPKANDARKILKQQFGMDISPNASWRQINQVFPFIKVDTQRDTQQRGQDYIHSDKVMADETKKAQGQKNRVAAQQRTNTLAKAGISRAIITGTFGQEKSNMNTGVAQQKIADSNTAQDPFSGGRGFYVMRPGMPPSANAKKSVQDKASQAAVYHNSLMDAYELIQQAGKNPTIFNQKWPAIQSAFAQATQYNIKAMGNGVANGPDIEQAIKQIGSPEDAITWIRSGLPQKMQQALQSIPQNFGVFAGSLGYIKSDKPHPQTVSGGSGGSGTRAPVNPAATNAANEAASQYGLPAPFGGAPQAQPEQTPSIPQGQDNQFVVGKQYQTSKGLRIFRGINPQTGKRMWE